MKVVSAKTMSELEKEAYAQGFSDKEFMENAGRGVADKIISLTQGKEILLLCGKGNNAGDAFVAGYYLLQQGYNVSAIQPEPLENASPLCQENGKRFFACGGKRIHPQDKICGFDLLVDGIFGTGFKGEVKAPYNSLIEQANQSHIPIVAIDIPSGLDGTTGETKGPVIQAAMTLFLGLPKTGFFLENGWNVVGKLQHVDFGLPLQCIQKAKAEFNLLLKEDVLPLLPPIKRIRQKYQSGYVIGLAGSKNMPGAALLSSLASLRGGCGIVRLLHPDGMQAELSGSPYELIKVPYTYDKPHEVLEWMQKGSANFVGPGMGLSQDTRDLLKAVIPKLEKPCVIDADALTIFSEEGFQAPKRAILTPHTGEMQTLLHRKEKITLDFETLSICQKYAEEKKVTLVLKGPTTFIFHPGETIQLSTRGDPGMATAGSGDVLTGLIASFLSQGLACHQAALLGVYLHGLSGEFAAQAHQGSRGIIASDLIAHFQDAFADLSK
jgi:ADP-dependent NAD(P)H-hydrate dehydratase / NAD(P)H-hydrate epimerase